MYDTDGIVSTEMNLPSEMIVEVDGIIDIESEIADAPGEGRIPGPAAPSSPDRSVIPQATPSSPRPPRRVRVSPHVSPCRHTGTTVWTLESARAAGAGTRFMHPWEC